MEEEYLYLDLESKEGKVILAFAELTYSLTDKPLFFIRRFIPPLRLGGVSLDLAFIVLLLALNFASTIVKVAL